MGRNEFKEVDIKIAHVIILMIKLKLKMLILIIFLQMKNHTETFSLWISYKTLFGSELPRIRFDEADGCIRLYDGIRYFVLFNPEKDDSYNRIRYLI